jgi:hypothetical protein
MVTGDCIRVDGAVKSSLGNDFSEVCAHLSFSPPQFFSAFSSPMLFGTLYSSTRTFITSSNVSKIKWPLTKEVPLPFPPLFPSPPSSALRAPVQKTGRNQRVHYLVKTTKIQNNARTAVVHDCEQVLHSLTFFTDQCQGAALVGVLPTVVSPGAIWFLSAWKRRLHRRRRENQGVESISGRICVHL